MFGKKTKLSAKEKHALNRFQREVCERATDIDPHGDRDWYSMSYGFFLAVGLDPEEATRCALEAKDKSYWA